MCEFVMMEGLNAPQWRGCKCYAKSTTHNNREIVLFCFFFIRAEGNICISQVTFASANDLQLEEIEFVHHTKCQRSKRD